MHVGDGALEFFQTNCGLTLQDIESLPQRILKRCKKLGLSTKHPVHFMIDLQRRKDWKKRAMTIAKVEPPIVKDGREITRAIVVFAPTFLGELKFFARATKLMKLFLQKYLQCSDEEYVAGIQTMLKIKARLSLSHEMVHLFATDEYQDQGMLPLFGLDRLEQLTDAINVDEFYADYQTNHFTKLGLAEAAPYLTGILEKRESYTPGPHTAKHIYELGKVIIEGCQRKWKKKSGLRRANIEV